IRQRAQQRPDHTATRKQTLERLSWQPPTKTRSAYASRHTTPRPSSPRPRRSSRRGPVPLPTEKNAYCVIRPPFKDKDSREHFEIRTHKRLIDIPQPPPKTVDSL